MISRLSKCNRFIDTFKKGSKNFLRNQSEFSLPKIAIKPSLADARNQNCFNMSTVFNLPIPELIAIPYLNQIGVGGQMLRKHSSRYTLGS